jgi:hypothetical protein
MLLESLASFWSRLVIWDTTTFEIKSDACTRKWHVLISTLLLLSVRFVRYYTWDIRLLPIRFVRYYTRDTDMTWFIRYISLIWGRCNLKRSRRTVFFLLFTKYLLQRIISRILQKCIYCSRQGSFVRKLIKVGSQGENAKSKKSLQ